MAVDHARLQVILNLSLGQQIVQVIRKAGGEARFVGGIVRDALIGRDLSAPHDIDMAMTLAPDVAQQLLQDAGLKVIPTGIDHGTITVLDRQHPQQKVELTTLRADLDTDGRHATVAFTADWHGDAARRDFTINSLYLDAEGRFFDPFGGEDDLMSGRVRFIGDAGQRIAEDYLRILRFFRFQAVFGQGEPDEDALQAIRANAHHLHVISGERQAMELAKLLPLGASKGLKALVETGVDRIITPSGFQIDALAVMASLPRPLPLAACYAALVAADSLSALQDRLRLPIKLRKQMLAMAKPFAHDVTVSDQSWEQAAWREQSAITGGGFSIGEALAWRYGVIESRQTRRVSEAVFNRLHDWQPPVFPLRGADLKASGMTTGEAMGAALDRLEDLWVESHFTLSRDDLLARL